MTKSDFVLMLVRSGLWHKPLDRHIEMTLGQYGAVMQEADKQCVVGVVSDCLKTNNVGLQKKAVIHMLQMQNSLTLTNKAVDAEMAELAEILNEAGIRYAMVKGQTLGALYPKPELRVPGDIDFYVDKKDIEKAVKTISEKWDLALEDRKFDKKHITFKHNGVNFELHRNLIALTTLGNIDFFDQWVENDSFTQCMVGGYDKVKTLSPTLNVLYTFLHLFFHFRISGVAMRQLCDLALLMHTYREKIEKDQLTDALQRMGFTKAFNAFGNVMIDKLGLSKEDFPYPISQNEEKWGQRIVKDILKYGNWGEYGVELGDKHEVGTKIKIWWRGIGRFLKYYRMTPGEMTSFIFRTMPHLMIGRLRKQL